MHRDKTTARILLILSIVHVAVADPAIVRQRFLDVDKDVAPVSEKRGNPGDTPQDLYPVPQTDNELPTTSGTPQLHNDQSQTSGPPPSQDDTSPESGDPQSHSGPLAGSKDPQLHDPPYRWWQHTDWRPTGEIEQGESSAQDLYPVSQMDDDPPPASGVPQLDNDPKPESGAPHLYNDPPPASGTPHPHNDAPTALGTPQLHDDSLTESETSSVHDDLPVGSEEFDSSYRWIEDLRPVEGAPEAPSSHEPEAPLRHVEGEPSVSHVDSSAPSWSYLQSEAPPPPPPETNGVLSDATKLKLKFLGAYGVFVGVTVGAAFGIHKLIEDHLNAYVLPFSPSSPLDI